MAKNKSPTQTSLIRTHRNFLGHGIERPNRTLPSGMAGFRISCLEDAVAPSSPLGSAFMCVDLTVR